MRKKTRHEKSGEMKVAMNERTPPMMSLLEKMKKEENAESIDEETTRRLKGW